MRTGNNGGGTAVSDPLRASSEIKRLALLLIKPSKYDDDGYVIRYFRGVLPSNTLATLAGLTEELVKNRSLGDVELDVVLLDELVQKIDVRRLARRYLRPGTLPVVALCGVQTNQFPRAADLARRFLAEGMTVLLGGFHVSGAIAMSPSGMPPECRELVDAGVTLVKGEVEGCWGDLLRDALHGRLQRFYDISPPPDISSANIPTVDPALMKRFASSRMGTIDAGRGCPFHCSFCTIVNVQGRKMRYRLASKIKERIRQNAQHGINYYFFTDDNFARNPGWEDIFDALIDLRKNEGLSVTFMMQVDTLAHRIPRFLEKAAEAGCLQVFIGMESLNPENLAAAGKSQNRVGEYGGMIDKWHAHGIACHVGYIIGFPFDTVESVRRDLRCLKNEVRADQASFFILTPLPGSQDHRKMASEGRWMDADYNRFDSFHVTTRHPRMTSEEWMGVYQEAWNDFYGVGHMKHVLGRTDKDLYWGLFKNFIWYRHSVVVESTHPMICGFFRFKGRKDRRDGYAAEPAWRYYSQRARDVFRWGKGIVKLYFEMQEVWLATRGRERFRKNVVRLRGRYARLRGQMRGAATSAMGAIERGMASVRTGTETAWQSADRLGRETASGIVARLDAVARRRLGRRVFWRRTLARLNPFAVRTRTRGRLDAYWRRTRENLARGDLFRINPFVLGYNFVRDARLCALFNIAFLFSLVARSGN